MKKTIDKFLLNDKLLYATPWVFSIIVIAYHILANIITELFEGNGEFYFFDLALDIIVIFFVFGIMISYKLHEKNMMKMLFGALLSERVIYAIYWVTITAESDYLLVDLIASIVFLLLYIIVFTNHLILGYGHKSSPNIINVNRIVAILILLSVIIWDLWDIDSIDPLIVYGFDIVYEAVILIEMLCIETKVDTYKSIRENETEIKE